MKNWKFVSLGEICDVNKNSFTKNDKYEYINYLDTGNITENKINDILRIDDLSLIPSRAKRKIQKNDVIFSTVRPNQKHYGIIKKPIENMICSTGFAVISGKKDILDNRFLYYYLSQDEIVNYLQVIAENSVSVYPSIKPTDITKLKIKLPEITEQRKIADVLDSLSNKIEYNSYINQNLDWEDYFSICRKIIELEEENQNLEAQAQAIFKSWFVDFEPFKNGKFVDSELGKIPEGWRVERLGAVCECVLGGTPSRSRKEYWEGNIPWINSGKTNEFRVISPSEFISVEGLKKSATKLLPKKTTILAITGATLGQVSLLEIDACANQSVVGILENNLLPYEYIYMYVSHNIEKIISHQTGGAQQHINKDNIKNFHIILPPQCELKRYTNAVENLYSEITNLVFQSRRLSQLRDTLLPKLMSGEIDVSDVAV